MRIKEIFKNTDVIIPEEYFEWEAEDMCVNAGCTTESSIFFSLHSSQKCEAEAISRGCRVIISQNSCDFPEVLVLESKNLRRTYAVAAYNLFGIQNTNINIIGVTGTCGKTSVASLIYKILNRCNIKCGFIGTGMIKTHNTDLQQKYYSSTTPDPEILYKALKDIANSGCRYVVMEVSSHALFYDKVFPLRFSVSIFTNLSSEHMDFHKSIEEYYECKKKLTELSEIMIVNYDDSYGRRLYEEAECKTLGVGCLWQSDICLKCVDYGSFDGISYLYRGTNFSFIARSGLCGAFNVYNTALALTAVITLGIAPYMAKDALKETDTISGRLEKVSYFPTVIIDYAHTADATDNVLKLLRQLSPKKLKVVFGCGGERDTLKRPVIASVSEKYADEIIVTTDNPRKESPELIINDIIAGFSKNANYRIIENRSEAIREIIINADKTDTIAILGKGAESYIIDKTGYHTYSDKDTIISALKERK